MFSGYGELSDDDMAQPAEKVLSAHETTVRSWLMSLSKKDLQLQVNMARDHKQIKKFIGFYGRDRKFAGTPEIIVDDLCEFDVWLKKLALSESKRPPSPKKPAFTPLPPKPATTAVKPSVKKGAKKPEDTELPKLSEADQELYKDWWGKYQTTPEQSSSPVESPTPTPGGLPYNHWCKCLWELFLVLYVLINVYNHWLTRILWSSSTFATARSLTHLRTSSL